MELHHSKHQKTYVTNLNAALSKHVTAIRSGDLSQQTALQQAIKFNGGGHINHTLFWQNLAPAGTAGSSCAPKLTKAIESRWGSQAAFEKKFSKALLGIQGSGWGWLIKENETSQLSIVTTKDQDPVAPSDTPIFGVDMWEHAYYLQYLNSKAEYVKSIWNIVNWKTAEERYVGQYSNTFKGLMASM